MDAMSDPAVHTVAVKTSSQVGKTEWIQNIVGFHVDQDPAPILLLFPTLTIAEAYSKDRLAPMIRDTPALTGKVASPRERDSGNTLLHKSFPGGHITMAGANSAASLASRPIRIVLCDEVDRYPATAGKEGDPVRLAAKRSTTFWNRKLILVSTPTVKGASRIERAYNESDRRVLFVACPECGERQTLKWASVVWTDNNPASAEYACEGCGVLWSDAARWKAIRACKPADWEGQAPFNGVAGFHLNEIYSSWSTLEDIVRAFLDAKDDPDLLKTWVNTVLGECWEEEAARVDSEGLLSRVEAYDADELPAGVYLLTAGVDVQDDRLEIEVTGWGRGEESFAAEHVVLNGDPDSKDLWQELDELLVAYYETEDGRRLNIEATVVDSGGHYTERVYAYCQKRRRKRVWAGKGAAGMARPVWPKTLSRTKRTQAKVAIIGVDAAKQVLYGRLQKVVEPGPLFMHFNSECDQNYFDQLTAEEMRTVFRRGNPQREWHLKSGRRNEVLDCTVYAYAAMIARNIDLNKRADRVDARGGDDEQARLATRKATATRKKQSPRRRSGGFVNSWKEG